ncbi:MAG: hypothetical protein ACPGVP_18015 [Thiolinea sp.]
MAAGSGVVMVMQWVVIKTTIITRITSVKIILNISITRVQMATGTRSLLILEKDFSIIIMKVPVAAEMPIRLMVAEGIFTTTTNALKVTGNHSIHITRMAIITITGTIMWMVQEVADMPTMRMGTISTIISTMIRQLDIVTIIMVPPG